MPCALTDFPARIFQTPIGCRSKAVAIQGTYSGTFTGPRARLIDAVSGLVVVEWTAGTFDAGVWMVPIEAPAGRMYRIEARDSGDPGTVLRGANTWGVGTLIACLGQSNMNLMFDDGTGIPGYLSPQPGYPVPGYRTALIDTALTWKQNQGHGAITLANDLVEQLGPVGLMNFAVNGSALCEVSNPTSYWLDTAAGKPYANFLAGLSAVGGDAGLILWNQGESDLAATSSAEYFAGLGTLYARICEAVGRDPEDLPFILSVTGTQSASNAAMNGIRSAQMRWALNTPGARLGPQAYDIPRMSDPHYTIAGYVEMGHRFARAVLDDAAGPVILSARCDGNVIDLEVSEPLDAFTEGALDGFEVSADGFATTLSQADCYVTDAGIRIELTAVPSAAPQVRYQYDLNDGAPTGNVAYAAGLPLRPTLAPITAG